MKPDNLIGNRYGMLTVIERAENSKNQRTQWLCKCDCGKLTIVLGSNLKSGYTRSCSCNMYKNRARTPKKNIPKLYSIWKAMKRRCYSKHDINYKRYGGRGITVCDSWRNNYEAFYKWSLSNGYGEKLSIDRIDNNGNYEPNNCRWADKKTQARNRSTSVMIEYNGETYSLPDWCEKLKLPYDRIKGRYWYMKSKGYVDVNRLFYPEKMKTHGTIIYS